MEFLFALFICPIIIIVASIMGYFIFKKWFVMPLLTLIVFTVLTFTVFNESFFIWVLIYIIISVVVTLIFKFSKK
ncbi:hypothetical protein BN1058_02400 [Paraliobacillus sp. PM-2]|uniref:DUF2651 family protein n=1 Tax=Paraliobacillus sp. PM-2 TaxID=1462524 RepID=UPI00061CC58B|nr:DUF2651 family protein [Paraliobacillus sp. PM-2]CQR48058.1 hypothetical protein BN1058_02400 [Paraliobacillus sp. PM-2]